MKFMIVPKGGLGPVQAGEPVPGLMSLVAFSVERSADRQAFQFLDERGESIGWVRADAIDAILPIRSADESGAST